MSSVRGPSILSGKKGMISKMAKISIVEREPECYSPNANPYPLCIGNGSTECKKCCLYENMDESPFEK